MLRAFVCARQLAAVPNSHPWLGRRCSTSALVEVSAKEGRTKLRQALPSRNLNRRNACGRNCARDATGAVGSDRGFLQLLALDQEVDLLKHLSNSIADINELNRCRDLLSSGQLRLPSSLSTTRNSDFPIATGPFRQCINTISGPSNGTTL